MLSSTKLRPIGTGSMLTTPRKTCNALPLIRAERKVWRVPVDSVIASNVCMEGVSVIRFVLLEISR
eukprot:3620837-Amphidinium_carterae.1